jgi:hypothetical protein
MKTRLKDTLDSVGLVWVTVLLAALMSSLIYLIPSLWQTWTHAGPTLVNPGGFVTGHDFVAFYAASEAVLQGNAVLVYDQSFMSAAQVAFVGSEEIGYLAFMYPPTYLLLISPLSTLPYLTALALWQATPFAVLLLLLRRLELPPVSLLMAAGAPAVAQALFAGQNGILLAVLLAGGLLSLGSRPLLAGVLLGLATAKPQVALLLAPALIAGGNWRTLGAMAATFTLMAAASAAMLGPETWTNYFSVLGQAREHLAQGQLPWYRMPTVYTALRMAGLSDGMASFFQVAAAGAVIGAIFWAWRKPVPADLRVALLLAGAPLATPFMYDYDLPFMLFAIALYILNAAGRLLGHWERILLLLVWI